MASSSIISLKTPRLSTGGISGTHFSHGPGEIFKRFVFHIRQTAFWRYFQAALLAWHHTKHNRVHKTFALCVFFSLVLVIMSCSAAGRTLWQREDCEHSWHMYRTSRCSSTTPTHTSISCVMLCPLLWPGPTPKISTLYCSLWTAGNQTFQQQRSNFHLRYEQIIRTVGTFTCWLLNNTCT